MKRSRISSIYYPSYWHIFCLPENERPCHTLNPTFKDDAFYECVISGYNISKATSEQLDLSKNDT